MTNLFSCFIDVYSTRFWKRSKMMIICVFGGNSTVNKFDNDDVNNNNQLTNHTIIILILPIRYLICLLICKFVFTFLAAMDKCRQCFCDDYIKMKIPERLFKLIRIKIWVRKKYISNTKFIYMAAPFTINTNTNTHRNVVAVRISVYHYHYHYYCKPFRR